jgi:CHAD domain-containing protein
MGSSGHGHDRPARTSRLVNDSLTGPADRILRADKVDDAEAIHRERIEIRRLRGRLHLFRPLLRGDVIDPLDVRLRDLGHAIGSVRDLDVMGARLESYGSRHGLDVSSWTIDVSWRGGRARDVLTARRASPRHGELLAEVRSTAASPPFRSRAELDIDPTDFVRERVRRRGRQIGAWVDELGELSDGPSEAELHHLRRRLRRARYSFEAASAELGKPSRRAAKALKELTDVLGDLHDSQITRDWLAEHPGSDRGAAIVAAMISGYELAVGDRAADVLGPTLDSALEVVHTATR